MRCVICNNFMLDDEVYIDPDTGEEQRVCTDCSLPYFDDGREDDEEYWNDPEGYDE